MAMKLALLSGKGGSGKTSIALSLSKLLSDYKIHVLLIDCDTATNGATYFFENQLHANCLELKDLYRSTSEHRTLLSINEYFSFIPSSLSFSDKPLVEDTMLPHFTKRILAMEENYDVIIFDCQAGYSDLLRAVLPIADENLMVMEPDAISSSAVRVLYTQITDILKVQRTYQIFNKITEEEYNIYKDVVLGTFFNALPPVSYNWEVRKAFALGQIPELASTDSCFGRNIYEIAKILFPDMTDKLYAYEVEVAKRELQELSAKRDALIADLQRMQKEKRSLIYTTIGIAAACIPPIILLIWGPVSWQPVEAVLLLILLSILLIEFPEYMRGPWNHNDLPLQIQNLSQQIQERKSFLHQNDTSQ